MATNIKPVSAAQSPVDQFVAQVLPPQRRAELARSLPSHIRPERFERNLVNALMQNPGLLNYDPRLVYREVSKASALGLMLDPQLGEAYLIEAYDYKLKAKAPQLRVGYRGLIKLARQSGEIATVYAHEVCAFDEIECVLGDQKKLLHKPNLFGERGAVVGYYAVVKYKDGSTDFEPMTADQINAVRDKSDGYKAFKEGKIKDTPWATSYDEMAKKTTIRRLMKRTPQSPDLADAERIEDSAERPMQDVTPPKPQAQQLGEQLAALPTAEAPADPQPCDDTTNDFGDADGTTTAGPAR